jgi:SAM-dependent methyltransferase
MLRPSLEETFSDMQAAIRAESEQKLKHEPYTPYLWTDKEPLKGYFYISLWGGQFQRMMKDQLRKGLRVIDVGCGAGDKLLRWQAMQEGMCITGLEYEPVMAKVARYVSRPYPNIHVLEGDAFTHDYSKYDLIYMYCPIKDREGQATLQQYVMESMEPGAKLFVALQAHHYPGTNNHFPDFERGWEKP